MIKHAYLYSISISKYYNSELSIYFRPMANIKLSESIFIIYESILCSEKIDT